MQSRRLCVNSLNWQQRDSVFFFFLMHFVTFNLQVYGAQEGCLRSSGLAKSQSQVSGIFAEVLRESPAPARACMLLTKWFIFSFELYRCLFRVYGLYKYFSVLPPALFKRIESLQHSGNSMHFAFSTCTIRGYSKPPCMRKGECLHDRRSMFEFVQGKLFCAACSAPRGVIGKDKERQKD